jgi:hypothetical protein
LSGRARVVPLDGRLDHDKSAFDLGGAAQDGVYVLFTTPRRVPLLECEPDFSDFKIANGAFQVDFRILAAVTGGLPGEATTVAVGEA